MSEREDLRNIPFLGTSICRRLITLSSALLEHVLGNQISFIFKSFVSYWSSSEKALSLINFSAMFFLSHTRLGPVVGQKF